MELRKCKKQCEPERIMRRKKKVDYFAYLPDDILFNILILLPAELLRYKFKYVCRRWFNIITNRILFDQASLIIQRPTGEREHVYGTRLVDINEGKFNLRMKEQYLDIPCRGRIRSWCNELLLITDPFKLGALYVFNLVTKEGSTLPPCSSYCSGHVGCKCGLGLAFDKFKGAYKVVHVFLGPNSIQCEILVLKCELLSFKCLKWKKINGPSYIGQRHYFWDDPISVEGRFFHWDVHSAKYIVSMDIVKERFRQTRLPEYGNSLMSNAYFFVEMGGLLSLLIPVSGTQVDVWILKDFQRTVWEKLQCIKSLSYVPSKIYPGRIHPVPIASLKNGSIIIFRKTGSDLGLFAYYLKCNHMAKLEIGIEANERCLVQSTAFGFEQV
uniref:F-box domain-containing protein n=1 Tax=Davidia involucrata TaxID=16924 RepID=A0A5B6YPK4_DAVIN